MTARKRKLATNGLCFSCGASDHMKINCLKPKSKLKQSKLETELWGKIFKTNPKHSKSKPIMRKKSLETDVKLFGDLCFACLEPGHIRKSCPRLEAARLSTVEEAFEVSTIPPQLTKDDVYSTTTTEMTTIPIINVTLDSNSNVNGGLKRKQDMAVENKSPSGKKIAVDISQSRNSLTIQGISVNNVIVKPKIKTPTLVHNVTLAAQMLFTNYNPFEAQMRPMDQQKNGSGDFVFNLDYSVTFIVTGKKLASIRNELQEKSGCEIQFQDTKRHLKLIGTREAIEKVIKIIRSYLSKYRVKLPNKDNMKFMDVIVPGCPGPRAIEIKITGSNVGRLIGKGGNVMKKIMEEAQVSMTLYPVKIFDPAVERTLQIIGKPPMCIYAQKLVKKLMLYATKINSAYKVITNQSEPQLQYFKEQSSSNVSDPWGSQKKYTVSALPFIQQDNVNQNNGTPFVMQTKRPYVAQNNFLPMSNRPSLVPHIDRPAFVMQHLPPFVPQTRPPFVLHNKGPPFELLNNRLSFVPHNNRPPFVPQINRPPFLQRNNQPPFVPKTPDSILLNITEPTLVQQGNKDTSRSTDNRTTLGFADNKVDSRNVSGNGGFGFPDNKIPIGYPYNKADCKYMDSSKPFAPLNKPNLRDLDNTSAFGRIGTLGKLDNSLYGYPGKTSFKDLVDNAISSAYKSAKSTPTHYNMALSNIPKAATSNYENNKPHVKKKSEDVASHLLELCVGLLSDIKKKNPSHQVSKPINAEKSSIGQFSHHISHSYLSTGGQNFKLPMVRYEHLLSKQSQNVSTDQLLTERQNVQPMIHSQQSLVNQHKPPL